MKIWVIFTIGIKLYLLAMFLLPLANPMIIPSYQISSRDHFDPVSYLSKQHLDQDHIYLDLSYLVPTYSNYNCVVWVKCDTSQS
jgi:hypothetical protein